MTRPPFLGIATGAFDRVHAVFLCRSPPFFIPDLEEFPSLGPRWLLDRAFSFCKPSSSPRCFTIFRVFPPLWSKGFFLSPMIGNSIPSTSLCGRVRSAKAPKPIVRDPLPPLLTSGALTFLFILGRTRIFVLFSFFFA